MSSDTQALIDLCEKLPFAERAEVTDFARFLLAKIQGARHTESGEKWAAESIANQSKTLKKPVLHEHDVVRVLKDVESDGYRVKKQMTGTIVSVYNQGEAFAVEIAEIEPGPIVVTLSPDMLERIWAVSDG